MFAEDMMLKIKDGKIPDNLLDDEELAKMIRLNLVHKNGDNHYLTIPTFTKNEFNDFTRLFKPAVKELNKKLNDLVLKLWEEFNEFVPEQVHDQINQYLAGYTNNIIGFTIFNMLDRKILAAPPKKGPLTYNMLYIDRPLKWQI